MSNNINWNQTFPGQINNLKENLPNQKKNKQHSCMTLNVSKKFFLSSILLLFSLLVSSILTTIGFTKKCEIQEESITFGSIWKFQKDSELIYKANVSDYQYVMLIFSIIVVSLSIYTIFAYLSELKNNKKIKEKKEKINFINYCFSSISSIIVFVLIIVVITKITDFVPQITDTTPVKHKIGELWKIEYIYTGVWNINSINKITISKINVLLVILVWILFSIYAFSVMFAEVKYKKIKISKKNSQKK